MKFGVMVLIDVLKKVIDSLMELFGSIVVLCVQDLFLCKLPKPFYDIKVGGVRGQKKQMHTNGFGKGCYQKAMLVPGIV